MIVHSVKDVGGVIRETRKKAGLTQRELAEACGCGVRFISELENGKPTVEFGRALHVLNTLSLDASVCARRFE